MKHLLILFIYRLLTPTKFKKKRKRLIIWNHPKRKVCKKTSQRIREKKPWKKKCNKRKKPLSSDTRSSWLNSRKKGKVSLQRSKNSNKLSTNWIASFAKVITKKTWFTLQKFPTKITKKYSNWETESTVSAFNLATILWISLATPNWHHKLETKNDP